MKNGFKKLLCLSLVSLFCSGLTGCSNILDKVQDNTKTTETVIKSSDGKTQITVFSDWKEDKALNEQATIQASNRLKEKYAIVISESLQDFSEDIKVEEFADVVKENMLQSVKNAATSDMTDMTVNGLPAKFFEIQGDVEKVKAKYLIGAVKGKNGIYQIITWTLNSKYDQNKEELKKVIESFKEL
jgi:hypothetical protein